jgi:hypothetical protein
VPGAPHKGGGRPKAPRDGEQEEGENATQTKAAAPKVPEPHYTLDQLKGLTADFISFVFCMQKMKLVANELLCGR